MRRFAFALSVALVLPAFPSFAQQDQTLADIRQELSVLYVEIQKLKRELSTTGAPSVRISNSGSVLERVTSIESALQTLTSRTEQLEFRIDNVVRDGTNRIGDLEFRLVELEGGDVSQLGETTTLGGPAPSVQTAAAPAPLVQSTPQAELAIAEKTDFESAASALNDGAYRKSADAFARFLETYPGSPLAAQAHLGRGKALAGLGDTRESARAYLAGFSTDPTGAAAPEALVLLGTSLGALGQVDQACLTLAEVPTRFPRAAEVEDARTAREALGCR